jgi:transcriptional regulator with XRE-family HTH domain
MSIEALAGKIMTRGRTDGKPVPMDAKSLGEVERGWYSPTLGLAAKIAEALDVSLSELVEGL